MTVSRRELMAYGAAGALTALANGIPASAEDASHGGHATDQVPLQVASDKVSRAVPGSFDAYDMRDHLTPRRLTLAMWDVAYALRHMPGGSFADYDRVLDEAVERGYNTLRIDPMPQWLDFKKPERILAWPDPHQPYMPWNWNTAVKGPVALWVIDFIEKLHATPFPPLHAKRVVVHAGRADFSGGAARAPAAREYG